MTRIDVVTPDAPRPGGTYSQGVVAGGFLFTAGLGPIDPATGQVHGSDAYEQTRRTLQNVRRVVEAGGATMDDVVKVTAHLQDLADFADYDRAYAEFFTPPYPVRTTVGSRLAGILVEIDVVAELPKG